jgi:pimeloyl-ACP methyl ester carboxylesterase
VHVRQDGPPEGKALVLLHGFSSSVHGFDRLTPLLAARYRVIRVDLRGHGCTGGHTGLDARSQGRLVAAVLDRLAVTGAAVAGHSYGADVAIAAAEQSTRVGELVVLGQAPDYSYATFPPGNGLLALPLLGTVLHRLAPAAAVRRALRYAYAPGSAADTGRQGVLDHGATSPAMARTVLVERRRLLAARPLDARLRDLGLPALAILGRHDRFYDCAKTAARYRSVGARVEIVPDAGHSLATERPERVAELLEAFLTSYR